MYVIGSQIFWTTCSSIERAYSNPCTRYYSFSLPTIWEYTYASLLMFPDDFSLVIHIPMFGMGKDFQIFYVDMLFWWKHFFKKEIAQSCVVRCVYTMWLFGPLRPVSLSRQMPRSRLCEIFGSHTFILSLVFCIKPAHISGRTQHEVASILYL